MLPGWLRRARPDFVRRLSAGSVGAITSTTGSSPTMANRTTVLVAATSASLLGLLLGLLVWASPVAAAPPASGGAGPEEEACVGRASGDACSLPNNNPGICAAATCNRLDYSGGSPPKAIEEACIVCKHPQAGPPMLGGDGGSGEPASSGAGAEAGADGEPSSGGAAASEDKQPPETSSRCQINDRSPSPAGLALLAGLLLIVRPRRSRA